MLSIIKYPLSSLLPCKNVPYKEYGEVKYILQKWVREEEISIGTEK